MPGRAPKPRPPARLGTAGKKLWRAIVSDLAPGWTLDSRELHLLEQACKIADELVLLEAAITEAGPTVEGSRGQTVVHPAVAEARGSFGSRRLGCSARSSSRIRRSSGLG